ncbi:MAG TPA: pyruvate kinase [Chthoniobacteraceae bacterium]|jgi:pyruvate kinase|nr:pyruvate kinase [Chthoniobacteraceae bacterium]
MTRGNYRHTKIVATLGPATESPEQLEKLILAGVDVIRLNMAHATEEWVTERVARIRTVSARVLRHVAIMMDVKGPEIRTAAIPEAIDLAAGEMFAFFTQQPTDGVRGVAVNYAGLATDVRIGAVMLVDSGLIRFEVVAKDEATVHCRVLTPGRLGSRRHINLPGVDVNLPALTEKDRRDIRSGVAAGVDFFALSFVRKGEDVVELKNFLRELKSAARIVAKIEDQAGVRNLEDIVREADSLMVARGDLGIEIDYHRLPQVQTQIVEACLAHGKPVIVATHLLESMISAPMPTRAEISDIANAVRERADAVMLSGETTTGLYPLECVEVMKSIISSTEPYEKRVLNEGIQLEEPKAKMLRSATVLAQQLERSGIVVFTRSGFLGYTLGALRPKGIPIYAFTDQEPIFRHLLLPWGVEPFLMKFSEDPEETIQNAIAYLKRREWVSTGAWLVVITNVLAGKRIIDTTQLRQVE